MYFHKVSLMLVNPTMDPDINIVNVWLDCCYWQGCPLHVAPGLPAYSLACQGSKEGREYPTVSSDLRSNNLSVKYWYILLSPNHFVFPSFILQFAKSLLYDTIIMCPRGEIMNKSTNRGHENCLKQFVLNYWIINPFWTEYLLDNNLVPCFFIFGP